MFLVDGMLILDQLDVDEMQLVDEDFSQTSISPADLKKRLADLKQKADLIDDEEEDLNLAMWKIGVGVVQEEMREKMAFCGVQ